MSIEKFTPGEWEVCIESYGCAICAILYKEPGCAYRSSIAWLGEKSSIERKENLANAYLISASPNMFDELWRSDDLLRDALKQLPVNSGLHREINKQLEANKKALKKARGEGWQK